jgi:hypothetical protein
MGFECAAFRLVAVMGASEPDPTVLTKPLVPPSRDSSILTCDLKMTDAMRAGCQYLAVTGCKRLDVNR